MDFYIIHVMIVKLDKLQLSSVSVCVWLCVCVCVYVVNLIGGGSVQVNGVYY